MVLARTLLAHECEVYNALHRAERSKTKVLVDLVGANIQILPCHWHGLIDISDYFFGELYAVRRCVIKMVVYANRFKVAFDQFMLCALGVHSNLIKIKKNSKAIYEISFCKFCKIAGSAKKRTGKGSRWYPSININKHTVGPTQSLLFQEAGPHFRDPHRCGWGAPHDVEDGHVGY